MDFKIHDVNLVLIVSFFIPGECYSKKPLICEIQKSTNLKVTKQFFKNLFKINFTSQANSEADVLVSIKLIYL